MGGERLRGAFVAGIISLNRAALEGDMERACRALARAGLLAAALLALADPLDVVRDISHALSGSNRVRNGGFDTGVDGWESSSTFSWNPLDAGGNPSSGSMYAVEDTPSPIPPNSARLAIVDQCVPAVTGGQTYMFSAQSLEPASQNRSGLATLAILWYPTGDCEFGDVLGNIMLSGNPPAGQWWTFRWKLEAPPGTGSARVRLIVLRDTAGPGEDPAAPFGAYFDNVFFGPDPLTHRLFVAGLARRP